MFSGAGAAGIVPPFAKGGVRDLIKLAEHRKGS